jgi:hypothetical protein
MYDQGALRFTQEEGLDIPELIPMAYARQTL